MIRIILCTTLVLLGFSRTNAATETTMAGIFLNTHFVEELVRLKSVPDALAAMRQDELVLLQVRADTTATDSTFVFSCSKTITRGPEFPLEKRFIKGLGLQQFITPFDVRLIVTDDTKKHEYIALHSTTDKEAKPDVFARIPSQRQDVALVIERVINLKTIAGEYKDASGKRATITKNQHASLPGKTFDYRIVYDEDAKKTYLVPTTGDTKYAVVWKSEVMHLIAVTKGGQPLRQPPITLTPVT